MSRQSIRGSSFWDQSQARDSAVWVWFWMLLGSCCFFLGTANPFVHIPLLNIGYPAALHVISQLSARPFRDGWLTGLLGAAGCLYWISVPVRVYGGLPLAAGIVCVVLLAMYIGLWAGFFSWNLARMRLSPWRLCLGAAVLWFLLEWARSWFLTGFPWLTLASGQAAWPLLIQSASLVGEYGLSAILAGLGACLAHLALRCGGYVQGRVWGHGLAIGICLAALLGFGALRLAGPEPEGPELRLTLVQGCVYQDIKWDAKFREETIGKYLRLSEAALASEPVKPDIVMWPETAVPFAYQAEDGLGGLLRDFSRDERVNLVFGTLGFTRIPGGAEVFNRACRIDAAGLDAGYYDKRHLVPFGEFVPPGLDLPIFAKLMQGVGGFTPGRVNKPFSVEMADGKLVSLGMLICYEAIFPDLARLSVANGAQVLLNISNDAWYDRTSAPAQHLYLCLMRSVEQKRWLARATNTGLTAFTDPYGRIHALGGITDGSGLFVEGALTKTITASDENTVYFYLQPWLPGLAIALFMFILWPVLRLRLNKLSGRG